MQFFILIFLAFCGFLSSEEESKRGIFAFPSSQQPGALFGFGGNIIDANEVQLYFFADKFKGKEKTTIDLIPSVVFGATDNFSLFLNFPFTPRLSDDGHKSSGLQDFFIQLEWAFYNGKGKGYTDQATLVGNITVPTGSSKKNPPTGFGAPSFFLGFTFSRTYEKWVIFTANGAILPTSDHGTKFGDEFLYQGGVARTIPSPEGWLYALMLEIDGQYSKKNRIKGDLDPNSGGNAIYVTPSFWISNKYLLMQFGPSFPINQHLFGKQHKFQWAVNFNAAWSFYP